jgi:hypothetical protein
MTLNPTSPVFWSTIAGAAAAVVGAVDPGSGLPVAVRALLIALGGLWTAIPIHHTVKAAVAKKP